MATFMDFVVRHRLTTMRPMENMEIMVSSHTAIYANTLPVIRYLKTTTAATVRIRAKVQQSHHCKWYRRPEVSRENRDCSTSAARFPETGTLRW